MIENSIETARLLVVSRDAAVLGLLWQAGELNRWRVDIAGDVWNAIDKIQAGALCDLLLLDLPRDDEEGLHLLRVLHRIFPVLPVVLIGYGCGDSRKREYIDQGARDYLIRPLDQRQFEITVRTNLAIINERNAIEFASEDVEAVGDGRSFVGICPEMRKLRSRIALLAEVDAPVFIFGESGSGRETIARLLHRLSVRSGFAFARVNCGALPEELLEQEIFGREANGIESSAQMRRGKLELCEKGTIFLSEITEMPLRLQSRLAQILQEGRFTRQGTSESVCIGVRIVVASIKSIHEAVAEHRLLADLARQLGLYELRIPALRERKTEIPFLARHFMHQLAKRYHMPPRNLTPAMSQAWRTHGWPGNLRELEESVKRYLVAGNRELGFQQNASDLNEESPEIAHSNSHVRSSPLESGVCGHKSLRALLRSVKEEAERNAIVFALEKTGWNRKAAARLLKTSYRSVLYKIEQYKLTAPATSASAASSKMQPRSTTSDSQHQGDLPLRSITRSSISNRMNDGRPMNG
ncbi:MAG TPA: sigma-54 dependent transcriptional regulator [Terracidiphilus sp.]|nr:sigma-54 dependent transcriptional regulator [Terracidiphilus sp.]